MVILRSHFDAILISRDSDGLEKSLRYGLRSLRNEAYLKYAAMTRGDA